MKPFFHEMVEEKGKGDCLVWTHEKNQPRIGANPALWTKRIGFAVGISLVSKRMPYTKSKYVS
ncbi:hypothetical protein ASJ83_03345 [Methanocorpusculum parvum]|uniref:Uncharacterized protein n=1 Tax=Methanocorpusculum parvum TaxID=2193 RepID=A0AAX0Q671_9EURY|nr:hypothetical protein ASJ83_03345 [Methanocorpusculum parvum]